MHVAVPGGADRGTTRKRVEVKMGGKHPHRLCVERGCTGGIQAGIVGAADIEGGI